jgi:hypothetical protein
MSDDLMVNRTYIPQLPGMQGWALNSPECGIERLTQSRVAERFE